MDRWEDVAHLVPPELRPWLDGCGWSPKKLRALILPVVELDLGAVAWMLDLPCLSDDDGCVFRVRPLDVVDGPHLALVEAADLTVPVDVTWRSGRFVVLDGLHRVLKAARLGQPTVPARIVPPEALEQIAA